MLIRLVIPFRGSGNYSCVTDCAQPVAGFARSRD